MSRARNQASAAKAQSPPPSPIAIISRPRGISPMPVVATETKSRNPGLVSRGHDSEEAFIRVIRVVPESV